MSRLPVLPLFIILCIASSAIAQAGAPVSAEDVFEQAFSQNQRILTFECQFSITQKNTPPGSKSNSQRYSGLCRFSAPDRFYVEYSPVSSDGTVHPKARMSRSAEGGRTTSLIISEAGLAEGGVTVSDDFITPIYVGEFLTPSYFRLLESSLKPDTKSVKQSAEELLIHCINANKNKETTLHVAPSKSFSIVAIDVVERIEPYGEFHQTLKYDLEKVGEEWHYIGGSHRQDLPDGTERISHACTIPASSIRINHEIPVDKFSVVMPDRSRVYDQVSKRDYTVGTATSLDQGITDQLATIQTLPTSASDPSLTGVLATESHWSRWQITYGLLALAAILFCISAYRYRAGRSHV